MAATSRAGALTAAALGAIRQRWPAGACGAIASPSSGSPMALVALAEALPDLALRVAFRTTRSRDRR